MQALRDRMGQVEELTNLFKNQMDDIKSEVNTFFDEIVTFKKEFNGDLLRF